MVKDLRAMTGSPLKDCMKALEETQGDLEKAKDLLRKRGLADAEKRVGRTTSEGFVCMKVDRDIHKVTMIEMTCETDFVAKTDKFIQGVEAVCEAFFCRPNLEIGVQ
jgi:elongation factor Ts